jgi:polyhydroxybutyrate depolymerase
MRLSRPLVLILATLGVGCSFGGDTPAPAPAPSSGPEDTLGGRTYVLKVPAGYDGTRPLPLVLAIHGYGSNGQGIEGYFGLDPVADEQGFFVAYPDGTMDPSGRRFFSATDACCDFYASGVDDVAFFDALIVHLESEYAIDPARIYAVGHSNGGFMSHRLACDLSSRLAAVVSLEGATWSDPSRCKPSSPVAVVEVHGTDDVTINPGGGDVVDGYPDRVYPSVAQTMATWTGIEGCTAPTHPGPDPGALDSETSLPTQVTQWTRCDDDVELWLIEGGTHVPALTPAWPHAVYAFLAAHPKPLPVAAATVGLGR